MALEVLAGPGCDSVGKESYIADKLGPDDVVISVGRIFKALTLGADVPSTNSAALRLALGLQTTAIRFARERQLSGFVLTGNGNRQWLDKLMAEAGASRVTVLKMTEAQACAAVRRVVSGAERVAACDEGIMRVTPELRGDELVIDQPLPDTQAGRDAAVEIRSGLMRGLSVEFKALKARMVSGVRRISEAALVAGGLVDDPSYAGSTVEVRDKGRPETWLRPWG